MPALAKKLAESRAKKKKEEKDSPNHVLLASNKYFVNNPATPTPDTYGYLMLQVDSKDARILAIDDEEPNVHLLGRLFRHWDFQNFLGVSDSREVVNSYADFKPDLILLDVHMPHLDGFDVLEALLPLIPEGEFLPIVMLTADVTPEVRQKALARGAKEFLTKPFDRTEIFLRVANLLETRRLHLKLRDQNATLEEKVEARTAELEQAQEEMLECLAQAAEYRDDETGKHTQRVGDLSAAIAQQLGLAKDTVEIIRRAAMLHDVGKIGIPDGILLKKGPLTVEEWDVMRSHTVIGERILARHHFPLFRLAAEIALNHHERWDGTGYPSRLAGAVIPLSGRIVAAADVYDALTNERVYKKAWTPEAAREEIEKQAGRQFDADIVHAFLAVLDRGLD